jgi:transcriptional regulator with XRE-family HTH domain
MKGNIDPEHLYEIRKTVGAWLKEMRTDKGLSQAELADKMGVDQASVSKVEAGNWSISVDMLALFCKHLNFPLKKLFDEKVPVRPRSHK